MLHSNKFKPAEIIRNSWALKIDADDRSQLARPEYWAPIAKLVRKFDTIEVQADDGTFWAQLLVTFVGSSVVRVHPLAVVDTEVRIEGEEELLDGYQVKHNGDVKKWVVTRLGDNKQLASGLSTRNAAIGFVVNHKQELAA